MATTQYIRSQPGTEGNIVVTARAVDPDGNIIIETYNITVTPFTGDDARGTVTVVGGGAAPSQQNEIVASGDNRDFLVR